MTHSIIRQASAFGLASIFTLAMLAGADVLATQPHGGLSMAAASTPATASQVVVVVGQRAPRS